MRIAVDAMGGDHAPTIAIEGAIQAVSEYDCSVILVGDHEEILSVLSRYDVRGRPISVVHASEVIRMDESPIQGCRQKKDASIMVATRMVKDGKADAVISAGNSGASMTSALMYLRRLPGVLRPAIATRMPTLKGQCIILDVGANVDCKPQHLHQFAIMGHVLAKYILEMANPRIGLISIGEEEGKGDETTLKTYELLKDVHLNFIGNIEGGDIFRGVADVIVCDGFVGNVILKVSEGLAESLMELIRTEIKNSLFFQSVALLLKPAFKNLRKKIDYDEYGGAPLLGIDGVSIISHGGSNPKAIKNAIGVAESFVSNKINQNISDEINIHGFGQKVESVS